jgi:hypothetical protein
MADGLSSNLTAIEPSDRVPIQATPTSSQRDTDERQPRRDHGRPYACSRQFEQYNESRAWTVRNLHRRGWRYIMYASTLRYDESQRLSAY